MGNLFNIQQSYFELLSKIEEEEGLISEEIEEELKLNEDEFNNKVDNCIKMIHHWEGEVSMIDAEIIRLNSLKKPKISSIESLKNNISISMQTRGIDKLDLGLHKLSFRKSDSVIIEDPTLVPKEFINKVTTETIDKNSLKKWLKDGNKTDGAFIEERKNLQIK